VKHWVTAALLFGCLEGFAEAEPTTEPPYAEPEEPAPEAWRFSLMPYLWALDNELTIGTSEYFRSDATGFQEALGQYQYGGLLFFEAVKEPWAIYMDTLFVRLTDESRELGLPVDSDIRQVMTEAAVARSVNMDWHSLDFLAGARYFRMKSDVRVRPVGRFRDKFEWVEPIVGVRHNLRLGERWRFDWRADAGGFGLGSDLTWHVNVNLHFDLSETYSLNAGYRHIDIDYRNGEKVYESAMSGPMIGMTIRF